MSLMDESQVVVTQSVLRHKNDAAPPPPPPPPRLLPLSRCSVNDPSSWAFFVLEQEMMALTSRGSGVTSGETNPDGRQIKGVTWKVIGGRRWKTSVQRVEGHRDGLKSKKMM
ncbi:unnamed protein product [Pleuronectes platessa]|uniref:Uncharacterized protein n=1 Tax=Pleuronectes platessa TaxID=8262 RepID=A0A9N7YHA0_PLEPL|nr:unnamed protein product [Pleuronectes platessa]